jgi:hypothetical protein
MRCRTRDARRRGAVQVRVQAEYGNGSQRKRMGTRATSDGCICAIQHTTCTPGIQRAHLTLRHTTSTPGIATCTPGMQRAHLTCNVHTWYCNKHTWHATCTPGMQHTTHSWHATSTPGIQRAHLACGTQNAQLADDAQRRHCQHTGPMGRWADRSGTSDGEAVELAVKRRGDRRADARLAHARRPDLPCGMGYRAARIGYHGMPTAVPGR